MNISVVIAVYNGALYLEETIQSVIHQSLLPDELIIVDDGSTDSTYEVAVNAVQNIPWARVIKQENKGQMGSMSTGILESEGDLIAFLDADDCWMPHHLRQARKAFLSYPELTLYFDAIQSFGEEKERNFRKFTPGLIGRTQVLTNLDHSYIGGVNSTLVASAVSLKPYLPLPQDLEKAWKINADNIVVWLTSLSGGLKFHEPEVGVRYRLHPQNNSKKLSGYHAKIKRQCGTVQFFNYMRERLWLDKDLGNLLVKEYRAQPTKDKILCKAYTKAAKRGISTLGIGKSLSFLIMIISLRIFTSKDKVQTSAALSSEEVRKGM